MSYYAITDGEITPNKPVSADLMTKIKGNFDDHEARIVAGSGQGGSIGEILNGSFEGDYDLDGIPDNCTRYVYPGGSSAIDTTDYVHGKQGYRFTHPGGVGNGGGYLETEYVSISHLFAKPLWLCYRATASGIKVQVVVRYFAADAGNNPGTYLGEATLYTSTANGTKWNMVVIGGIPVPYYNARYIKYRLIGGHYDTNVAGSVIFDAVGIEPHVAHTLLPDAINQASVVIPTNPPGYQDVGSVWTVTIPQGSALTYLSVGIQLTGSWSPGADGSPDVAVPTRGRFRVGSGATYYYSSEVVTQSMGALSDLMWAFADVSALAAGTYNLRFQGTADFTMAVWGTLRSVLSRNFYAPRGVAVDAWLGTQTIHRGKPAVPVMAG